MEHVYVFGWLIATGLYFDVLTQSHGAILESVHLGYYLDIGRNSNLRLRGTFQGAGIMTCINACKTSLTCDYVNFRRTANVCFQLELVTGSTPDVVSTQKAGYLYGSKSEWNQASVDPSQTTGCGLPPEVSLADHHGNMYVRDSKIQYVCTTDQTLTDESVCMESGQWSESHLNCITECGIPPTTPYNSEKTGSSSLTVGSQITYSCKQDTTMSQLVTCQQNGSWDDLSLTCIPEECLTASSEHVFGTSCYVYVSRTQVWSNARDNCELLGGYLASISDAAEMSNIGTFVKTIPNFTSGSDARRLFIGLTDEAAEGTYIWLNGDTYTYAQFALGEPNGQTTENCVMFTTWNLKWYDMKCNRLIGSLCEFDLN